MSTALPPASAASPWRWWVCLLLMLATVINYMDRMALNQMAKRIKEAFDLNNQQYGQLESVFSLAFALGAIGTGYIVDRASVRWVYPLMVLGWSVAGVLTGFASSFWMLLTCRFALANWLTDPRRRPARTASRTCPCTPRTRSSGRTASRSAGRRR